MPLIIEKYITEIHLNAWAFMLLDSDVLYLIHENVLQPCPIFILSVFLCICFTFSSWPNWLHYTIGQASFFTETNLNQWTGTYSVGWMFSSGHSRSFFHFMAHRCLDKRAFQLKGRAWNRRNYATLHYVKKKDICISHDKGLDFS